MIVNRVVFALFVASLTNIWLAVLNANSHAALGWSVVALLSGVKMLSVLHESS